MILEYACTGSLQEVIYRFQLMFPNRAPPHTCKMTNIRNYQQRIVIEGHARYEACRRTVHCTQ
jgi:hypothetical protein